MNKLYILLFLLTFTILSCPSKNPAPLFNAVEEEDYIEVEKLLNEGYSPNSKNHLGYILNRAIFKRNKNIVNLLLQKGANPNAYDKPAPLPLSDAISSNQYDIVILLLKHGADPNLRNPITQAIINDKLKMVKLLVDNGARFEDEEHVNIELYTASTHSYETVKYFVDEKGSDPNNPLYDVTPLMVTENVKTAKFLISRGADVNRKTKEGYTALHGAAGGGNLPLTRLLVSKGADPNAKTKEGETPLDMVESWLKKLEDPKQKYEIKVEWGLDFKQKEKDMRETAAYLRTVTNRK